MPILPSSVEQRCSRFAEQRWLLDAVIKTIGPEWDQSRIAYMMAPCSPNTQIGFAALRKNIKKFDDMAPEMTKLGRRLEMRAKKAVADGHEQTACDHYFAASVCYGGAQWPIFDNTPFNLALGEKKSECYAEYMKRADHHVEKVEVPYQGQSLPGYLHLPPGYKESDGPLPTLILITGMDGVKEFIISSSSDRYLQRGFACLALDGPGQGECLTRGIWNDPDKYGEVGTSAYEFLAARPEVDEKKIMLYGVSFGSFWCTQIAAAEPRIAACAVTYTNFQPDAFPLMQMASPTFKQRQMYMSGIHDEAEFDIYAKKFDIAKYSAQIKSPYLVIAGEDDELSDTRYIFDHFNNITAPKSLVLYAGGTHEIGQVPSYLLGPFNFDLMADWFLDRANGKPMESEYTVVDSTGKLHTEPWGEDRVVQYGAPMDFSHLFGDSPETGTA